MTAPFIRPPWKGPMMHPSCYEWVGKTVADNGLAVMDTLEVGSFNFNGTVRDHFSGLYHGIDASPGPNVDEVGDAESLQWPDDSWGVVVSTEMLEHVQRPWRAVAEMARVTKNQGHVILTARGYDDRGCWEVHGYPSDYWRFGDHTIGLLCVDAGLEVKQEMADPEGPGWFVHALKP